MSRSYSLDEMAQPRDPSPASRTDEVPQPRPRAHEPSDPDRTQEDRTHARPAPDRPISGVRSMGPRKPYDLRNRTYRLRDSEIETMVDIGKFRALATKDLEELAYAGNRSHLNADLLNLRNQGLILQREMPRRDAPPRRLVALTQQGQRLLIAHDRVPKKQKLYHGFSKLRESHHDADLYRLYQKAIDSIARKRGTNVRIVLDSELKTILYRDLARAKRDKDSTDAATIAQRNGLKVIRGKIPVPDLRIEYETPDRDQVRVDLELATEHYRFRNLAQKVGAGFAIYARADELTNLRRVMDERELVAQIMSL
jgi:hypothetical protein